MKTDGLKVIDTDVSEAARIEAAETDRGAMTPRPDITNKAAALAAKTNKKKWLPLLLVGGGFVGMVTLGLLSGGEATESSIEKDAESTASDAARAVAADPMGNTPIGQAGPAGASSSLVQNDNAYVPKPGEPGYDPRLHGQSQTGPQGQYVVPPIDNQGGYTQRSKVSYERRADEAAYRREAREQAIAQEQAALAAKRRAPMIAIGGRQAVAGGDTLGASLASQDQPAAPRQRTELESRLNSSEIARVGAGNVGNRNFLIAAGTQIPCVLQTAMDSTLPGFTSCVVPRAVFSDNGKVVLLDKGTRILGEFHGGMQQGQGRIFIVWNRAVTPSGVKINLGSPAADGLGRAGMGGDVETFFWKRFGGALLLSVVGDVGKAATQRISGAEQTFSTPSEAANTALENDIKIPPRLRAPQGMTMTVFAARDFDFANIYSLRLKR